MSDLRKAAEMELEALESYPLPFQAPVKEALRQALAQPKQEPVGWYDSISGEIDFTCYKPFRKPSFPSAEWIPVYTAPPKREWVGLTDEQIESIWDSTLSEDVGITALRKIARVIEAKLREKNT